MSGNMAHLFSEDSEQTLIRAMIYGVPKSRKTWWIGKAAEDGFNVIFADGDNGFHILRNVPESIRNKRITRVACYDDVGRTIFSPFIISLLKERKVTWNDTRREKQFGFTSMPEDCNFFFIDLGKLTNKDILVLDSWTKYCDSLNLRYALENGVDMTEAKKWEWEGYNYAGMLIDWTLNALASLPCHVVIIGHETQYEKYRGSGRERTLISSTTVMKSSSGPKAMTVPSGFSDILYFHLVGGNTKIDTRAEKDRLGGSRGIAPGSYEWNSFNFSDICKSYNIAIPGNPEREFDCAAFRFHLAGSELPEEFKKKSPIPAANTAPKPIASQVPQKATLTGLLGKK